MSHTYHYLLYHLVWSTKERRPLILTEFQNRLYEYMAGSFKKIKCYPILIGGMPDHIHACVKIPPDLAISEVMRNIKVSSTKWTVQNFPTAKEFSWQEGYGAFSVSASNYSDVINYINKQEHHHKKFDFKSEFLLLLDKHGVEFEEKYLWK